MRILVLGINCFPELTGIGKYSGEMVEWLADQGHTITVVTAPPYYPNWKVQDSYSKIGFTKEKYSQGKLTVYRCPLYVPSNPSGLKRLIHEVTFLLTSFLVVFKLLFEPKHDIIFAVTPPFHLGFLALFYRIIKGGKIVYHIQDLQIDAARELKMLPDTLFPLLFSMERFIMKNVDAVFTISDGMQLKVRTKTNTKVKLFPNWVDSKVIRPLSVKESLRQELGFGYDDKIVLYSGNLGEKQGLESIIRVAIRFRNDVNAKFVICGSGGAKEKLQDLVKESGLSNVFFFALQPYESLSALLAMADIHLILQKSSAADLVMPSKLTGVLAAGGCALVTASPGTSLYEVIKVHNMGIIVEPESDDELEAGIRQGLYEDNSFYKKQARSYAEAHLDKGNILKKFELNLLEL